MSLNAHDQRELDAIEHELSGSDPKLALLLATFTRLAADEEMPVREGIRARGHLLNWGRVWLLLTFLIGLALIAVTVVAAVSSGGRRACSGWAAACAGRAPARAVTLGSHRGRPAPAQWPGMSAAWLPGGYATARFRPAKERSIPCNSATSNLTMASQAKAMMAIPVTMSALHGNRLGNTFPRPNCPH